MEFVDQARVVWRTLHAHAGKRSDPVMPGEAQRVHGQFEPTR